MAVAQSELISIPGKIFRNMYEEYPSILLATIQPVLHRTQKAMRIMTGNENCKYALILPTNDTIKAAEFKKMIKALEEKNIPIDAIGGASVGALIGACYALTRNYQDTYNMFQELTKMVSQKILLKEITWPLISIFNAKHPTQALQNCFSDIQIEDLLVSYFCVTANLSTQTDEVHNTGSLWEKTRASNALPGIVPPMVLNGQMHFDGGLINNLPIDHMKNIRSILSNHYSCFIII